MLSLCCHCCGCSHFAEPWPSNVVAAPTATQWLTVNCWCAGSRFSQQRASIMQMVTQGRPQCIPKWPSGKPSREHQRPKTSVKMRLDAWLGSSWGVSHNPNPTSWVPHTPTVGAVAAQQLAISTIAVLLKIALLLLTLWAATRNSNLQPGMAGSAWHT